ncbi:hypothetical protein N1F89_01520 [Aquibium sp. A9E412]|uniref:hypothetical protein n=1 Tax=Aquibium sp. A9E412 TaxID=2976767 RepID=UPI0025B05818|nr:hypothetical protein [Aquibium sp. A9E412]MDN2564888.1 hypothetical protein [Aquibium sp. A9E412]
MSKAVRRISTAEAIETLVHGWGPGRIVSMADAVRAVRTLAPHCELTDDELVEPIARCALARRVTLNFDLPRDGSLAPVTRPAGGD